MSTPSSPSRSPSETATVELTPLLNSDGNNDDDDRRGSRSLRRPSLLDAARFLRRAGSRQMMMMRDPLVLVRDLASSKPVVVLDMIWNFAFVVLTAGVMVLSRRESPSMPLRMWIVGYGLQCVIHMACVFVEYRRRRSRGFPVVEGVRRGEGLSSDSRGDAIQDVALAPLTDGSTSSVVKHLESANTMFSFIWWIIGFYLAYTGGQVLAMESPQLYWLCIIRLYLAFDVLFVVFCVAVTWVIGIAVCCCLPCIIAIFYAVADQEGASREDVEHLTKYKFRKVGDIEKLNGEVQGPFAGVMTKCDTDAPIEHTLSLENAECCICLSPYDDGAELRALPCGHHFHCACVDKWLYINATCPLCKYILLKSSNYGNEEV